MSKVAMDRSFRSLTKVLFALAGLLFFACHSQDQAVSYSDVHRRVITSLDRYAVLLRQQNRPEEAARISAYAKKLREPETEPSTFLGFDPTEVLHDYAALLRTLGKEHQAKEVDTLALAWYRANVEGWQRLVSEWDHVAAPLIGDKLIVPGERIGRLQLGGNANEIMKMIGPGVPRSPGFQKGTTTYTWDPINLWLIADDETGEIVWISVASNSLWNELSTRAGVRLGLAEKDVVDILGPPSHTYSDRSGKSLYYDEQGIRLFFDTRGPLAGKVTAVRVVRPRTK